MATQRTSAGTSLAISTGTPSTFDAAGYNALTWTDISNLSSLPAFGLKAEIVSLDLMASRNRIKKKGAFDGGEISAEFALDEADAGQILLQAAVISDNNYSFRVTGQSGVKRYFQAQPTSAEIAYDNTNSITMLKSTIAVTAPPSGNLFVTV